MLTITYTKSFKQDFKRLSKQHKNLELIGDIIKKISTKESLAPKHRDHPLIGNYKGKRECHITPDWLLVYETNQDELVLHRTGSHSELFR